MDEVSLLKLSIQRALLGQVTENLLGVTCRIANSKISIWSYFSDCARPQDKEAMSEVASEVIADFADSYLLEDRNIVDAQEPLVRLDFWVFVRAGVNVT